MANTTNLDLIKPLGTDHALISQINGNMDKIDLFAGNTNSSLNSLADGLAIISVGDTHAAISSGQYVYVKGHNTLSEGLYVATTNIAANGALSGSNLTADSSGGLNALISKITTSTATITGAVISLDVKKSANVVNVNFSYVRPTTNINANSATEIATLPDGYRPSANIYRGFVITGSSGNLVAYARATIYATGKIEIYVSSAISTSTDLFGGFDFCI